MFGAKQSIVRAFRFDQLYYDYGFSDDHELMYNMEQLS